MTVQFHEFENPFPELIQEMFSIFYNYSDPLDQIHTLLNTDLLTNEQKEYHNHLHAWSKDRNSIFVKRFHEYVDKYTRFNETYLHFIRQHILPLYPDETKIVIQKTPNIRFSLPNNAAIGYDPKDPENIIGVHCDGDFGHHSEEMNYIIPITHMFGSNSIFYEPSINSDIHPTQFENLVLNTNQFAQAYFNKLRHCNKINQTNSTRISFDIRIIPYSKYEENLDYFRGTKFELGKYYIVLQK
jgi:hypothetical protein